MHFSTTLLLLLSVFLVRIADGDASCQCPFQSLDSTNLESITGTSPSYSNISSLPISTPNTVPTSDNCSISVSCPSGYSLMVYYYKNFLPFYDDEVIGTCNNSSKKWTLEDEAADYESGNFYEQFVFGCFDYATTTVTTTPATTTPAPCTCNYTLLNNDNLDLISSQPQYPIVVTRAVSYPTVETSSDNCSVTLSCSDGDFLLVMNMQGGGWYTRDPFMGTCNPSNSTWSFGIANFNSSLSFSSLTAGCIDIRHGNNSAVMNLTTTTEVPTTTAECPCFIAAFDKSNWREVLNTTGNLWYATSRIFFPTGLGCEHFTMTCPVGSSIQLLIYYQTYYRTAFNGNQYSSPANAIYNVVEQNDVTATCNMTSGRWEAFVWNNRSYLKNVKDVWVTCETLELVTTVAPTTPERGPCFCNYTLLDNSTLHLISSQPQYSTVSKYSVSLPDVVQASDNCSVTLSCSNQNFLLVMNMQDGGWYTLDTVKGFCNGNNSTWTLGVNEFETSLTYSDLVATCVDFTETLTTTTTLPTTTLAPCTCNYTLLTNDNLDLISSQPQYSDLVNHTISSPDVVQGSDNCSVSLSCPGEDFLLVMNMLGGGWYTLDAIEGTCNPSNSTWSFGVSNFVTSYSFSSLVAACVAFCPESATTTTPAPCTCNYTLLNNDNLDLISTQPQYPELVNHTISFPDVVQGSDNCSVSLSCPDGDFLLVMNMLGGGWYTLDAIEGTCNSNNSSWSFKVDTFEISYTFSNLVAACVKFCPETTTPLVSTTTSANCQCNYIPLTSSTHIPTVNVFSSDNCTLTMSCDSGYVLDVFGGHLQENRYTETATAVCQRSNSTWLIGGTDNFDSIEAYCRAPSTTTVTTTTDVSSTSTIATTTPTPTTTTVTTIETTTTPTITTTETATPTTTTDTTAPTTTTETTTTTPTTTTTTTTPSTTTTRHGITGAASCTKCTLSQMTFGQASGIKIDTTGTLGTDSSTGCLTMAASCTADLNYYAYMQFNSVYGGPAESTNNGRTITANLNCVNGNWVYTQNGYSMVITQVTCNQAPLAS